MIRVACVGYTNAWPLTRHLDPALFHVVPCIPSVAARMLNAGEVDVGLVPVASLFDAGVDLRIVPGLAIGCDGDVRSVFLVGERPLSEWTAVALDGESRTSVVLAQVLLRGPLGRPDLALRPVDPGTGAFHAQGSTGAVVIGDAARNLPARLGTVIDLGRVWRDWTGLPFVFAVWAGRPDLPPEAIEGLRRAAQLGLPERATAPAAERTYLTEHIRYQLDDRATMGLRRFVALAQAQGLLGPGHLSLYGPGSRQGNSSLALDGRLGAAFAARTATPGEVVIRVVASQPTASAEPTSPAVPPVPVATEGPGVRAAITLPHAFGFSAPTSAQSFLREVVARRLSAPGQVLVLRVPGAADDHALGVAQVALAAGVDEVVIDDPTRLADVEHHVRTAGFEPRHAG